MGSPLVIATATDNATRLRLLRLTIRRLTTFYRYTLQPYTIVVTGFAFQGVRV